MNPKQRPLGVMNFKMAGSAVINGEVLHAIIQAVVIVMMDYFRSVKVAIQIPLHFIPMFKHIPLFVRCWMLRVVDHSIATAVYIFATQPVRVVLARPLSLTVRANLLLGFCGVVSALKRMKALGPAAWGQIIATANRPQGTNTNAKIFSYILKRQALIVKQQVKYFRVYFLSARSVLHEGDLTTARNQCQARLSYS